MNVWQSMFAELAMKWRRLLMLRGMVLRLIGLGLMVLFGLTSAIAPADATVIDVAVVPTGVVPTEAVEAVDSGRGAQIFAANCAGCHVNGGNIIRRGKNLKLKALQKNQVDTPGAIAALVTQGKGNMSAYGEKLSADDIQLVSQYVLDQANQNWKN